MEQHEIRLKKSWIRDGMSTRKVSCIPPDVWRWLMRHRSSRRRARRSAYDCAKCIPDDEKLQICEEHDIPSMP